MAKPSSWTIALATLSMLGACGGNSETFLSGTTEQGSAHAALLFVDRGADRLVYAVALPSGEGKRIELEAEGGEQAVAVLFREDLAGVGLLEGPVPLPELGDLGRALPRFFAALRTSVLGAAWGELETLPDWVAETKLPIFDGRSCLSVERCIRARGEDLWCADDCEAPTIAAPDPPAAAALPDLSPCPPGWTIENRDDGAVSCLPDARSAPSSCAPGEAVFSDSGACQTVGPICPPSGRPPGPGVRVPPGDGTIFSVSATAGPDATLLLSAGRYSGPVVLAAGQTLRGACSALTIVEPSAAIIVSAELQLEGLTLIGSLEAQSGARLELDGVRLQTGAIDVGRGAELQADRLYVTESSTVALHVHDGGIATLRGSSFERLDYAAIRIKGRTSSIDLQDLLIRDALREGIQVVQGAQLMATRLVLLRTAPNGLRTVDPDSRADLTLFYAEDIASVGLMVVGGSIVVGDRLHLRRMGGTGISLVGTAMASLSNVIVEDVSVPGIGPGDGISSGFSELVLDRVSILRTAANGLLARGSLTARDVSTADSGLGTEFQGPGILVGGLATIERAHVSRARNLAVWTLFGGSLTGSDFLVDGTAGYPDAQSFVNTFNASDISPMNLTRVRVLGLGNCGGLASQRSRIDATEVSIEGCSIGLVSEIEPAKITVTNLYFQGGGHSGMYAKDSGQIAVTHALLDARGTTTGVGLNVEGLGRLDVDDFVVVGPRTGLRLGMLGTAALTNGSIESADLGVLLEAPYDPTLFPMLDSVRLPGAVVTVEPRLP